MPNHGGAADKRVFSGGQAQADYRWSQTKRNSQRLLVARSATVGRRAQFDSKRTILLFSISRRYLFHLFQSIDDAISVTLSSPM